MTLLPRQHGPGAGSRFELRAGLTRDAAGGPGQVHQDSIQALRRRLGGKAMRHGRKLLRISAPPATTTLKSWQASPANCGAARGGPEGRVLQELPGEVARTRRRGDGWRRQIRRQLVRYDVRVFRLFPLPPPAAMVVAAFPGSADYTSASAQATFTIDQVTPTVSVSNSGGTYSGSALPATATVTGGRHIWKASAQLSPTMPAAAPAAPPSPGRPLAGTYTVVAAFPGSTDYTSASAQATFTISQGYSHSERH